MKARVLLVLLLGVGCGGADPGATDETDPEADSVGTNGPTTAGGETAPGQTARASGRNFSVPVPVGYRHLVSGTIADMMRDDVITPGGVILMAQESDVPGVAPGSIVVSPTAADISSDAVDEGLCGQLANLVAGQHEATVERSGMVELPFGRACQWTLRVGDDENRLRLGTVFAAHAEDWIVTCNHDERDDAASAACNAVLSGWSFE